MVLIQASVSNNNMIICNENKKFLTTQLRMNQCEIIMRNQTIMNQLNSTLFDLVLADPSVMCGELIATKMDVPFVYNVRTLPGELQFTLSQTPMPLAYVPMINTEFSDRMNLVQRTFNLITYLYQTIGVRAGLSLMDSIVHKYISPDRNFLEIVSQSSMWLIRDGSTVLYFTTKTEPLLEYLATILAFGGFASKVSFLVILYMILI